MAPFDAASAFDGLIIASNGSLITGRPAKTYGRCHGSHHILQPPSVTCSGTIDAVQKLHLRSVPLGEQPRRIVHAGKARAFAVLTSSIDEASDGEETETCHVRLLDDQVSP